MILLTYLDASLSPPSPVSILSELYSNKYKEY